MVSSEKICWLDCRLVGFYHSCNLIHCEYVCHTPLKKAW